MGILRAKIFLVSFVLLAAFGFTVTAPAQAHESEAPYVKINGEYVLENPVLDIVQPTSFKMGADIASSSGYSIGKPVVFEVDERYFPNPYAQAQNAFGLPVSQTPGTATPQFRWDFKDDSPAQEGSSVSHIFTTSGTYIVELGAKFEGKTQEFATINTIEVRVFPSEDYLPPVPKIIIDGKAVDDPGADAVSIKPMKPVVFDASATTGDSLDFQWDFGDGKGAQGETVKHRYARDAYFPVVVVRVTDNDNISVDAYALMDMPFEKPNVLLGVWYAISDFVTGLLFSE